MATKIERLMDQIDDLTTAERAKFEAEWNKLGKVKKRWAVYVAGIVSGALVASALWLGGLVLFGCMEYDYPSQRQRRQAVQTGPNSACFPGPRVIE